MKYLKYLWIAVMVAAFGFLINNTFQAARVLSAAQEANKKERDEAEQGLQRSLDELHRILDESERKSEERKKKHDEWMARFARKPWVEPSETKEPELLPHFKIPERPCCPGVSR